MEKPIPEKRLPARLVQDRYNVCSRTLARWLSRPELNFPRPLIVNGRRYFAEVDLVAWERARAAAGSEAV